MEDTLILTVVTGPTEGVQILLTDGESVVFGRSPKCGKGTIAGDRSVGWRQFLLEVRLPRAMLRSLGKTNPTFVNGIPHRPSVVPPGMPLEPGSPVEIILQQGDRIQAGRTILDVAFASMGHSPPGWQPVVLSASCAPVTDTPQQCSGDEIAPPSPKPDGRVAEEENRPVLRSGPAVAADPGLGNLRVELGEGPPAVRGFSIGRLLKRGSLGGTYAARRESDGKPVVLKVARLGVTLTSVQIEEIWECLLRLAGLRHPNIVALLDFGLSKMAATDSGGSFAVLCADHCDGACLADAVRQTAGILPPHTIYDILLDALDAIDAAHSRGVYHYNLKPQNFFIIPARERTQALLTDFRVPVLFRLQRDAHPESIAWVDRDAAPFSPPSRLAATPATSPDADLWSIGAIGYYLLNGHPPEGRTPGNLNKPLGDKKPSDAQAAGSALRSFVGEALCGRFKRASDMRKALAALDRPRVIRFRADFGGK